MKVYEYTFKGMRECNEDYITHCSLSDSSSLFVVADGMGGYSHGDIASRLVAEAIIESIKANYNNLSPVNLLQESVTFANEIIAMKRLSLNVSNIGAVVVILLIVDDVAFIQWLGDSRAYLFRKEKEVYHTVDHSIINELKGAHYLTASELEKYSSIVTKSIMGEDSLEVPPVNKIKIKKDDVFILCTDGVYKEIDVVSLLSYDDTNKEHMDIISSCASDNFSFIKIVV